MQHSPAFILDSLESSHSISVEVNDANEATSLFDKISYDKVYMSKKFMYFLINKKNVIVFIKIDLREPV